LDLQVVKVLLETQDRKDPWVLLVYKEQPEHRVPQANRVFRVMSETQDRKVPLVPQANRVFRAILVPLV
jgi:hypothetical protein